MMKFWFVTLGLVLAVAEVNVAAQTNPARQQSQNFALAEGAAVKRYCATATPLACSQFQESANYCIAVASSAYSIFSEAQLFASKGMTARQAVGLAERNEMSSAGLPYTASASDIEAIADRALADLRNMSANEFRIEINDMCLKNIAE